MTRPAASKEKRLRRRAPAVGAPLDLQGGVAVQPEPPVGAKRNLYAQVAAVLGREIVGGVYAPGSALPKVDEVCARFEVSRTALREAYSILAAKGLISAKPKVGTLVRPRTEWNALDPEVLAWHLHSVPAEKFIKDLYTVRRIIEPAAAALAAEAQSATTRERLQDAFERMVRFKDGEGDLIAADLDFHMAILGGQDNLFLGALGGLIHTSLQAVFSISWEGAARIQEERLRGHEAILLAILRGEPEEARRRMSELLADSGEDVRAFLDQRRRRRGGK